jgi:hypothetical protein
MSKLSEYVSDAVAAGSLAVYHDKIRKAAGRDEMPIHRNPADDCRLFKRRELDKFLKKAAKWVTKTTQQTDKDAPLNGQEENN